VALVLSLTQKQQYWLEDQLANTLSTEGKEIYEKLIRPVKPKKVVAPPSDAPVATSLNANMGTAAADAGSNVTGSTGGAVITEDGFFAAPPPEWDDTPSRAGSEVLQPTSAGIDLELDSNQHPDGFSADEDTDLSSN